MVKKKTGRKKKRVIIKSRKQNIQKTDIIKVAVGLFFLILLVFAAGFFADRLIIRKQPQQIAEKTALHKQLPKQNQKKKANIKLQTGKTPKFEIYPKEEIPSVKSIIKPIAPSQKKMAKVAIIIDDIGYDNVIAEKFIKLDPALTVSVLPYSPFQQKILNTARKNGIETMLHLPMESVEYPRVDPGPGVILASMTPDQLIHCLNEDIDTMCMMGTMPFITGVNNHMGSKITADSTKMNQIFSILKKRGLFFIDSRTTLKTICKSSAHLLQIPFAERDVFIDHIQDAVFISNQINLLVNTAIKHGQAIGIAHPHAKTYDVLSKMLPDLKKKVLIVPVSELVHII